jgi:hypothetical protein
MADKPGEPADRTADAIIADSGGTRRVNLL